MLVDIGQVQMSHQKASPAKRRKSRPNLSTSSTRITGFDTCLIAKNSADINPLAAKVGEVLPLAVPAWSWELEWFYQALLPRRSWQVGFLTGADGRSFSARHLTLYFAFWKATCLSWKALVYCEKWLTYPTTTYLSIYRNYFHHSYLVHHQISDPPKTPKVYGHKTNLTQGPRSLLRWPLISETSCKPPTEKR